METCNVCKKLIEAGQGLHAWNMMTGHQAIMHNACEPTYSRMGYRCQMGEHQECLGVVYIGEGEEVCSCECHQR